MTQQQLQPGQYVHVSLTGVIESANEHGYMVRAHAVEIPVGVTQVMPEEEHHNVLARIKQLEGELQDEQWMLNQWKKARAEWFAEREELRQLVHGYQTFVEELDMHQGYGEIGQERRAHLQQRARQLLGEESPGEATRHVACCARIAQLEKQDEVSREMIRNRNVLIAQLTDERDVALQRVGELERLVRDILPLIDPDADLEEEFEPVQARCVKRAHELLGEEPGR